MPTITQLQYILAVERERNFSLAAKSCHVAQPSLSAQIQKLEEELETIIFDRSRKPIAVTENGQKVLDQARVVLKEHERLVNLSVESSGELRGEFNLAIIPTLAPYLLPLFLRRFSEKWPKVKLVLNEMKTDDIIESLKSDVIDAGLLVTPLDDPKINERHLFFEPFFAYLSQSHPLQDKKQIAEMDLSNHSVWLLQEGHCLRDQVLKVCDVGSDKNVIQNVNFTGGNLETLRYLVQKNDGYTLLPELATYYLSEEEYAQHVRPIVKPVPTREVSLVHNDFLVKKSIMQEIEKAILETLPPKIKSHKRQNIEVVGIR